MTHKLRFTAGAAALALIGAGTQFAIAQTAPGGAASRAGAASKDSIPMQMTVAPVSRPLDAAALHGRSNVVVALTKNECTEMGGVVGDPAKGMNCSSGWACYTASAGGAIRNQCITEK